MLIDGTNKEECKFLPSLLAHLAASIAQAVLSSILKSIRGRGELQEQEEDIWIKAFNSTPSFTQYQKY